MYLYRETNICNPDLCSILLRHVKVYNILQFSIYEQFKYLYDICRRIERNVT